MVKVEVVEQIFSDHRTELIRYSDEQLDIEELAAQDIVNAGSRIFVQAVTGSITALLLNGFINRKNPENKVAQISSHLTRGVIIGGVLLAGISFGVRAIDRRYLEDAQGERSTRKLSSFLNENW